VATEPKALQIQIDADPRFAAAVGGAAHYFADTAGLNEVASAQLQSSVVTACLETFAHLSAENPRLRVTLAQFAGRIEVALAHLGESLPAVGLDAIAGFAAQIDGAGASPGGLAGVDRVQYETNGRETVTRLTKYLSKVNPKI
jgi:hypothetical protein